MSKPSKNKTEMQSAELIQGSAIQEAKENPFKAIRDNIEKVTGVSTNSLEDGELTKATQLVSYMEAMKAGKIIVPSLGGKLQKRLFTIISSFTSSSRSRFEANMTWLLNVIAESRKANGVFSDRMIYRFMPDTNVPPAQKRANMRLMNLLLVASGIRNRTLLLKRVDLDAVIDSFKNPQLKDKLLIFFGDE